MYDMVGIGMADIKHIESPWMWDNGNEFKKHILAVNTRIVIFYANESPVKQLSLQLVVVYLMQ